MACLPLFRCRRQYGTCMLTAPTVKLHYFVTVRRRGALPIEQLTESIKSLSVSSEYEVTLCGRDIREIRVDHADGVRPVASRMGIVAGPHQALDTDSVTIADGKVIRDVGVVEVLFDQSAR